MTPGCGRLFGNDQLRSRTLFGCFADPQRVTRFGKLGLSLTQLSLEFARSGAQTLGFVRRGAQLVAQRTGEGKVLAGAFTGLLSRSRSCCCAFARGLPAQFDNDGVKQCGGQNSDAKVEDRDETCTQNGREGEDGQRGHGGNEPGGS